MGSNGKAKVDEFLVEGVWRWSKEALCKWPELQNSDLVLSADREDSVIWVSQNGKKINIQDQNSLEKFSEFTIQ